MKIIKIRHFVEVHTPHKVYVYFVSPVLSRIDAVDDVLARHKESYPDSHIESVKYLQEVNYTL